MAIANEPYHDTPEGEFMKRQIRNLFNHLVLVIWMVGACGTIRAQSHSTVVRIVNATGVEGIPGIILLVNPGRALNSQALITDEQGTVVVPNLKCEICIISALDPRGLFFSRTTEFSGQSPSLTIVLEARPIIDTIGDPSSILLEFAVRNPEGESLPEHKVTIRPALVTVEDNWFDLLTTDSRGHVKVRLRQGEYAIGALVERRAMEAKFRMITGNDKCGESEVRCIQASRSMRAIDILLSVASPAVK